MNQGFRCKQSLFCCSNKQLSMLLVTETLKNKRYLQIRIEELAFFQLNFTLTLTKWFTMISYTKLFDRVLSVYVWPFSCCLAFLNSLQFLFCLFRLVMDILPTPNLQILRHLCSAQFRNKQMLLVGTENFNYTQNPQHL